MDQKRCTGDVVPALIAEPADTYLDFTGSTVCETWSIKMWWINWGWGTNFTYHNSKSAASTLDISVSEELFGSWLLKLGICQTQPIFTNTETAMLSNLHDITSIFILATLVRTTRRQNFLQVIFCATITLVQDFVWLHNEAAMPGSHREIDSRPHEGKVFGLS